MIAETSAKVTHPTPDALALAEEIAQRCEDAHPYQDEWRARCPNHQGKSNTSLSVTPQDDRVLVHCHGGCDVQAIVHAMGLTLADLFVSKPEQRNGHRRIVAEYDYVGPTGILLFQAVRYDPKDFRQRRPDPARPGEWIWDLKDTELVPYHLPEIIFASPDLPVYIMEGERDADALHGLGLIATCNPMGAGKWRKNYSKVLTGRDVVILPDHDRPGRDHAQHVAVSLYDIARSVKVVPGIHTEASGSDVSDWLRQGGSREALDAAVQACPCWTPVDAAPAGQLDRAPRTTDALPYSDYTNALAFVREHGATVRYCYPWKSWLVWTGTHWERDTSGAVMRMAKQTIKRLAARAVDLEDTALKALLAHIKSSLSTAKLKAMLESAQSEHGVAVQPEEFDTHPWLLNCANGTLDLQTGTLRPYSEADLLTQYLPVAYEATALCPLWDRFVSRIMDDNTTLVSFLQRAIGYALTGVIREHVLIILWGKGRNGKSTFLNLLRALLGGYAMKAPSELLMVSHNDRHPTERADLYGKRFVAAIETEQGRRLAEVFVKEATGGDPIRARRMREDFWEFQPTHKVFLATNHKPVISGTDEAIWERIKPVPFTVSFTGDQQDMQLPDKLQAELPGILAWAVRGCLAWQLDGLGEPAEVKETKDSYRAEMDVLGQFITECCLTGTQYRVRASTLYDAYIQWSGDKAENQRTWGKGLTDRGFERFTNNGTWYREIALRDESTDEPRKERNLTEPTSPINGSVNSREANNGKQGSVGSVPSVAPVGRCPMGGYHNYLAGVPEPRLCTRCNAEEVQP